ncbi:uncharacterized protein LOC110987078 [Acanthaster planci]|uniref:Uncharacterized protein LOC110987078 n=1 Tax=Acanthaster planci TaxID=133434 RepID=A0A8B7ZHZ0_ACAPL|nr:uncharacterized protein LOC110987078 [Acanthaster planci]XP_022105194.1 uncharacterized protein LOC110987078 [Acanthaster planci]
MDKQPVFNNLTAWFARSVSARRRTLWVKHGGKVVSIPDAQFIFSQDVEDWDTESLFKTEDYLIGCLTVFHAGFIDACLKNNSAHKTTIGKYLLLPKDAPKVLHGILIPEDKPPAVSPRKSPAKSATGDGASPRDRATPAMTQNGEMGDPLPEGGDDACSERTGSGDRQAVAPTGTQSANGTQHETMHEQRRSADRTEECRSDSKDHSTRRHSHKIDSADFPKFQDIDITKIPHVKDLPKVTGPIVDFVIGRNGFGVQKMMDT